MLTTILENIAALGWIALGIYYFIRWRGFNKRLDALLLDLEDNVRKNKDEALL